MRAANKDIHTTDSKTSAVAAVTKENSFGECSQSAVFVSNTYQ